MTNPFDLRGPEFLAFYLALGTSVVLGVAIVRWLSERGSVVPGVVRDYLQIAYLRGGPNEALRVATLALVDRGLLTVADGDELKTAESADLSMRLKPLEHTILTKFDSSGSASDMLSDATLRQAAADECGPPLVRAGALPNIEHMRARDRLFVSALVVLAAVALVKILVAFARGRQNVLFLVAEALVFAIVAYKVTHPWRLPAGRAMLDDLRTLFSGLKDRASSLRPGGGGEDFALLAAVFGTAAVPTHFSFARTLFPKASTSSSSGCGSSCGSSSSSSCGSSCGGGCGGGCGGCGG